MQSSLCRRLHLLLIFYSVSLAIYSVSPISLCQIVPWFYSAPFKPSMSSCTSWFSNFACFRQL
uniref:Secreted protein n=1 Tax=Anguilla anguilla TaxID=7936 RepID=A0A0E9PVN2_ANGAN